jgi:DNA-binding helix-hairpin-helix protein with protein kinase domain
MVEAENPFRLDKTSILYMYKVVKHLLMQCMAIWVHPYFIKPMEVCQVGWTWVTTVYKPYQYDIVDSRNHFRLNTTSILYIYKVFNHLLMQWMAIWMHP